MSRTIRISLKNSFLNSFKNFFEIIAFKKVIKVNYLWLGFLFVGFVLVGLNYDLIQKVEESKEDRFETTIYKYFPESLETNTQSINRKTPRNLDVSEYDVEYSPSLDYEYENELEIFPSEMNPELIDSYNDEQVFAQILDPSVLATLAIGIILIIFSSFFLFIRSFIAVAENYKNKSISISELNLVIKSRFKSVAISIIGYHLYMVLLVSGFFVIVAAAILVISINPDKIIPLVSFFSGLLLIYVIIYIRKAIQHLLISDSIILLSGAKLKAALAENKKLVEGRIYDCLVLVIKLLVILFIINIFMTGLVTLLTFWFIEIPYVGFAAFSTVNNLVKLFYYLLSISLSFDIYQILKAQPAKWLIVKSDLVD